MKRVVMSTEAKNGEVSIVHCWGDMYYLGLDNDGIDWVQIIRIADDEWVVSRFNRNYVLNLKKFRSVEDVIRSCWHSFTFYQFPTFRAAMQYYIEQTKEVEGE